MDESLKSITQHADGSVSTIHHILRAPRRRLIILYMANQTCETAHDAPLEETLHRVSFSVRDLAKQVVAIEEDIPLRRATGAPYHNAYNAFTQIHLKRLNSLAAIRYDPDRKVVKPGKNLFPLATVSTVTSPLIRNLFGEDIGDQYPCTTGQG